MAGSELADHSAYPERHGSCRKFPILLGRISGLFSGLSPRSSGAGSGQHGGMTDAPYRRLLRPLDDRIVAGVCSAIGRYFGVDPVLIRVAFAIFAVVTWGVALIAYPLCWFLIPEEPAPTAPAWRDPSDPNWGNPI